MSLGYFRVICSNGLVIPFEGKEASAYYIKGKHTNKLSNSLETLHSKLLSFASDNNIIVQKYKVLTDTIVHNWSDRLLEVLNATKVAATESQLASIEATIRTEANTLGMGSNISDWLIYNGINYHIYNGVNSKGNTRKALTTVLETEDKKVLMYMLN
jgi:hypothetical protein